MPFIIALIIRYMVSVHTKKCVIAANREPACLKWQKRIFRWTGLLPTEAGQKFGVTSILVGTGYGAELHKEQQENGEKPPYVHYAADLEQAAQWILERK